MNTVEDLMTKITNGDDIVVSIKSLAVLDIPTSIATDLKIVEVLTPLSSSPVLSGSIHEILKKLNGKMEKSGKSTETKKKRRSSIKKGSTKRRSSGVTKKVPAESEDVKENIKTKTRLFKKKEPMRKDSAMWKKVKKALV